jgi:hypothetical protein
VSCEIGRNRQTGASIDRRTVTAGAASLRSGGAVIVLRVVKLQVERFIET